MAVNIKFDLAGNPEPPTIILANRNGNKLGLININDDSIELVDKFNDASEFSFTMNKYINGKLNHLWDKVVNFKLVYCDEWDLWFEIVVELDESNETVKTVTCTQLGQAELSQINLYGIHINEEGDSNWNKESKTYKSTILYNPEDTNTSLLHRLLKDKAPHYSIVHVDPTIAKLQRTFSFDSTSIYDAFMDIAEEIGCLFIFHSNGKNKINRTISVYDLWQNCKSCGHRGEYIDECPECGSKNIKYGYGKDTLIFVTADELASDGIELTADTDAVKNCFKLEAGDDLMTATIRNCNPNGTDYIWRFSEDMKEDMSKELVKKLDEYDDKYNDCRDNYVSELDADLFNGYNALVEKYEEKYNAGSSKCLSCNYKDDSFVGNCPKCGSSNTLIKDKLKKLTNPINGYSSLMNTYYNVVDLALFLESSMMPSIDLGAKTNAKEQATLLTASSLSPVAVANIKTASKETAKSAVLSMAKIIVKSTYKLEAETSGELNDNGDGTKTWNGYFTITNYSDETDTAITDIVSVVVNGDSETFIQQKIDKALNKEDSDDYSISGLFEMDYDAFCDELKIYALNPLKSFYDASQTCLTILTEQGAGDKEKNKDLYDALYKPYFDKSVAIEAEMKIRESEVDLINGVYKIEIDADGKETSVLDKDGLKQNIEKCRNKIQEELDFEKYLGNELWVEFCSYRREDTYSNDNYKSDGLSNAELFKKATEFYEVANNEIYKSSEFQHSISTSLNNLLSIDKFKPFVNSFNVGNWIRVQVDDKVYKLRLIEYSIDFGSFEDISVDFSDVTKIKNGITDVKEVLSQASSMATSYGSVQRQAKQGNEAKDTVEQWTSNGLNSALVQIQNNNNEEVTFTESGLLCRSYDDVSDTYSPKQLRLTHNILALTEDNWNTVSLGIGEHDYRYYDSTQKLCYGTGYGVSAKFLSAGYIDGTQIIGGEIYSDNYTSNSGTHIDLNKGTFSFAGGKLRFDGGELLISSPDVLTKNEVTVINEEYLKTTTVYAENLEVGAANIQGTLTAKQINTEGLIAENISGTTITGKNIVGGSININNRFIVNSNGSVTLPSDATISWNQVTGSPNIITEERVTQITKNTVTTSYVNALKVTAGSVAAENITGTTITGKTISGGTITGANINSSVFYSENNFGDALKIENSEIEYSHDGLSWATLSTNPNSGEFNISTVSDVEIRINSSKQITFEPHHEDNYGSIVMGCSSKDIGIDIRPYEEGGHCQLGNSTHPFKYIHSINDVTTSDRRLKKNISDDFSQLEVFYKKLKPVIFEYSDMDDDRERFGFIAQDIESALIESGFNPDKFAILQKSEISANSKTAKVIGDTVTYSLNDKQLIALNTHMIQNLIKRVEELENK